METRDRALFYVAAKTSARLRPPLPDATLPAVCHPVEIYTTLKETGSFVHQISQIIRDQSYGPHLLLRRLDQLQRRDVKGNPTRASWFLPQIVETPWGN